MFESLYPFVSYERHQASVRQMLQRKLSSRLLATVVASAVLQGVPTHHMGGWPGRLLSYLRVTMGRGHAQMVWNYIRREYRWWLTGS